MQGMHFGGTENDVILQRIVGEFDKVCNSRKLNVNIAKSKVMAFKRARKET